MTDDERKAIGVVNSTARRWLSRDELSYKLIWSQIARFTTSPKEDSRFSPSDQQIEKAAADLGYQFAMLEETTDRVAREVEQAGRMKQQARRLREKPNVATTTSSTMVSDWYNLPDPSERQSLTAYRSYLEWALLLARKLSLVVSHTQPGPSGDDVLVCHLVGEPNYKLKPIPSELSRRINKLAAHSTYFEDSDGPAWPIPEIQEWTGKTIEQLTADLRGKNPHMAQIFEDSLSKYRKEVSDFD